MKVCDFKHTKSLGVDIKNVIDNLFKPEISQNLLTFSDCVVVLCVSFSVSPVINSIFWDSERKWEESKVARTSFELVPSKIDINGD